jgi:hypothetical protein
MALNTLLYNVARNAALDAGGITALLANGKIQIRTGSQPAAEGALTGTLLATLTFGATALGAAASGVATANAITSESNAPATGTAGYVALLKSDNATVVATGSVGTSGANLNLSTLTINATNIVSCSSLTLTIPAQGA